MGILVAFNGYSVFNMAYAPAGNVTQPDWMGHILGSANIHLLDTNVSMPVKPNAYKPDKVRGDVCFDKVTLSMVGI